MSAHWREAITARSRREEAASSRAATAVLVAGVALMALCSARNFEHCEIACGWEVTSLMSLSFTPLGARRTWATCWRIARTMRKLCFTIWS